jgi:hypothetical protein
MRDASGTGNSVTSPAPVERTVTERPPEGLARGLYPTPAAAVITLAVALVVATLVYYAVRFRRVGRR